MASRGIRNNNPGNIEKGQPWDGLATAEEIPPSLPPETRFDVFRAPQWGIRAMARVLRNYQLIHAINTIRGVITRWAPPPENNT